MCKRATAKFGRVSSRPTQKLGVDLGIAIVPCEALSRGAPEMRKITYAAWSFEMNKWLVKMRSLFRVMKPGISILLRGHSLSARRDNLAATIAALQRRLADAEALTYTPIGSETKLLLPA
jgi:hypothetical protein